MKATVIHATGDASALKFENNFPKPAFNKDSDQILIRVVYAGVNFIDTYFRSGLYPVSSFPKVLGQDGSGYIEEIGDQVPSSCGLKVGDRVAFTSGSGSYAEYVLSGYVNVVKVPDEVSLQDAATCMVQGITAYYLAFDIPSVRSDVVLVHAAAGLLLFTICIIIYEHYCLTIDVFYEWKFTCFLMMIQVVLVESSFKSCQK